MPKPRIEFNSAGFREILTSAAVGEDLRNRGEAIAANAGPGHLVEKISTSGRQIVIVATDTFDAMLSEATDRTLTRALDAGR